MHALEFKRANLLKVSLVGLAAMLAACLLAMMVKLEPSQAAFPGQNGKIAFTSFRDGNAEIYTMNPDGSNQTNVTNNAAPDHDPAWSPDGTKIAFSRSGEIYTMNADGSNQTNVTNNAVSDFHPSWAPDGTRMAFVRNRDGNAEIYTMNADGSNQTNVTNNAAPDHDPAWSPDGTKIAFVTTRYDNDEEQCSCNNPSNEEIYVMNADGSGQTQLTDLFYPGAYDRDPAWSPDGTKIAFESYAGGEGGPSIEAKNADGSPGGVFLGVGEESYDPAWSPDGTRIAFRDCLNDCEIYTVSLDRLNETNLSSNVGFDGEPDWQPAINTAPTIKSLRPPPGSSTTDRTPTVAATVTDQHTDLAKSNITLLLDDVTIPRSAFSYNPSTDRMSYTPEKKLALGKHALKVTARDGTGLGTTKRWSFTIVNP